MKLFLSLSLLLSLNLFANPFMRHIVKQEDQKIQYQQRLQLLQSENIRLKNAQPAPPNRSREATGAIRVHIVDSLGAPFSPSTKPKVYDRYGYSYEMKSIFGTSDYICTGLYPREYAVSFIADYNNPTLPLDISWHTISSDTTDAGNLTYVATNYTNPSTPTDTLRIPIKLYTDKAMTTLLDTNIYGSPYISIQLIPENGSAPYRTISGYVSHGIATLTGVADAGDYRLFLYQGSYNTSINNVLKSHSIAQKWLTNESIGQEVQPVTLSVSSDSTDPSTDTISCTVETGGALQLSYSPNNSSWAAGIYFVLVDSLGYTHSFMVGSDQKATSASNITPGEYYLKTTTSYGYTSDYFYPGTPHLSEAQKVTIVSDDTTKVSFSVQVTSLDGGASATGSSTIKATITDEQGNPQSHGNITIEYQDQNFTSSTYISQGVATKNVDSGRPFIISINGDDDMYLGYSQYQDGKVFTLADKDTLEITMVMPKAGSAVGIITNSQYSLATIGTTYYEAIALNKQTGKTYTGSLSQAIQTGYRFTGLNPSSYALTISPLTIYSGEITTAPQGAAGVADTMVTITQEHDSQTNFTSPTVSGMISGILQNSGARNNYYVAFAVRPDGSVASTIVSNNSLAQGENYGYGVITTDGYIWNLLHKKGTFIDMPVDIPLLDKGDYYIAIVAADTSKFWQIQWYGEDTPSPFSLTSLLSYNSIISDTPIPPTAKKVTLATSSSHVNLQTLGAVPITQAPLMTQGLHFSGIHNGTLHFSGLSQEPVELSLYSVNGRRIAQTTLVQAAHQWNINTLNLSRGAYLLSIKSATQNYTIPFNY